MCILILTNINWIYKNHPYEYVFFNSLVKKPYLKFDLDWWGLSNYDQIKYILNNDNRRNIKVTAVSGTSLEATRKNLLNKEEMSRIEVNRVIKFQRRAHKPKSKNQANESKGELRMRPFFP